MNTSFNREPDNTLVVRIGGNWNIAHGLPSTDELKRQIGSRPAPERVAFDTRELGDWDSSLLTFLAKLTDYCRQKSIQVARQGLPEGVANLLDLATAVPEKKDARKSVARSPFLAGVGSGNHECTRSVHQM